MKPRLLSNIELADLPDNAPPWQNFSEDPTQYFVSVGRAWEVDEALFNECKDDGILCLERDGKYIVSA